MDLTFVDLLHSRMLCGPGNQNVKKYLYLLCLVDLI